MLTTDGDEVSTVQVRLAGVGSTVPEVSVERTWKVCEPFESALYAAGEAQAANAAPSSEHSNVAPAAVDENVKEAEVSATVPTGPESIVV